MIIVIIFTFLLDKMKLKGNMEKRSLNTRRVRMNEQHTPAAGSTQGALATVGISDVKTLLILLESTPDASITLTALDALIRAAEAGGVKQRTALLNAGTTRILFKLLTRAEAAAAASAGSLAVGAVSQAQHAAAAAAATALKKAAVTCFAAISEVPDVHADMKLRDPVVLGLLRLLEARDEVYEVKDEAAFALANCAVDCMYLSFISNFLSYTF